MRSGPIFPVVEVARNHITSADPQIATSLPIALSQLAAQNGLERKVDVRAEFAVGEARRESLSNVPEQIQPDLLIELYEHIELWDKLLMVVLRPGLLKQRGENDKR
jgi:hypothetical protein